MYARFRSSHGGLGFVYESVQPSTMCYPFTELSANLAHSWQAALILNGIVKQRRNGHFLIATIFHYKGSYAK